MELTPQLVETSEPAYSELLTWPFPTEPFYAAQVLEVLRKELPAWAQRPISLLKVWQYLSGNAVVAFGSLDVSSEYAAIAGTLDHFYIPVLGVHPEQSGKGYGKQVIQHLIEAATSLLPALSHVVAPAVFLDVYIENTIAVKMYEKLGFGVLVTNQDPAQNNQSYHVMARKLA